MTTPKRAAVGLCQHCDQPVYPGQEEIVPVITGGVGGVTDVLLHKGGCRRTSEEPRRHN
jgi:alkyl hydroperoxide reductase subunit AhpF